MTTRENVHQIVDMLPEERLEDVLDYLAELSEPDETGPAERRDARGDRRGPRQHSPRPHDHAGRIPADAQSVKYEIRTSNRAQLDLDPVGWLQKFTLPLPDGHGSVNPSEPRCPKEWYGTEEDGEVMRKLLVLAAFVAAIVSAEQPNDYQVTHGRWLCRPGQHDLCDADLTATVIRAGERSQPGNMVGRSKSAHRLLLRLSDGVDGLDAEQRHGSR